MFVEPGFMLAQGRNTFSFNFPIAFYRDRKPDPYTGNLGDATFPRYIALASYGFRFGGKGGLKPVTPSPTPDKVGSESGKAGSE